MARVKIRIKNPLTGGAEFTSVNRARRFVKHGGARFTSAAQDEIEFLDGPQREAVAKSAEQRLHECVTGVNVDNLDRSFFEHAKNLPLLNPHLMLRGKPRSRKQDR